MRVLAVILSLLCGVHHIGVVTHEVYQGYSKHNDLYIVEVCGVSLPIISDDFNVGDEMELFIEDGVINTIYVR